MENQVAEETDCLNCYLVQFPENQVELQTDCLLLYLVHFPGSAGGQASLALDVQGACELLCVIPGSST